MTAAQLSWLERGASDYKVAGSMPLLGIRRCNFGKDT